MAPAISTDDAGAPATRIVTSARLVLPGDAGEPVADRLDRARVPDADRRVRQIEQRRRLAQVVAYTPRQLRAAERARAAQRQGVAQQGRLEPGTTARTSASPFVRRVRFAERRNSVRISDGLQSSPAWPRTRSPTRRSPARVIGCDRAGAPQQPARQVAEERPLGARPVGASRPRPSSSPCPRRSTAAAARAAARAGTACRGSTRARASRAAAGRGRRPAADGETRSVDDQRRPGRPRLRRVRADRPAEDAGRLAGEVDVVAAVAAVARRGRRRSRAAGTRARARRDRIGSTSATIRRTQRRHRRALLVARRSCPSAGGGSRASRPRRRGSCGYLSRTTANPARRPGREPPARTRPPCRARPRGRVRGRSAPARPPKAPRGRATSSRRIYRIGTAYACREPSKGAVRGRQGRGQGLRDHRCRRLDRPRVRAAAGRRGRPGGARRPRHRTASSAARPTSVRHGGDAAAFTRRRHRLRIRSSGCTATCTRGSAGSTSASTTPACCWPATATRWRRRSTSG